MVSFVFIGYEVIFDSVFKIIEGDFKGSLSFSNLDINGNVIIFVFMDW